MRVCIILITLVSIISAEMKIIAPESLSKLFKSQNSTMDVVYANFGHIPYG
jgi:hypothetical protein